MRSPYDVLAVEPGAGDGEIEEAFRRRVIETHPDQGGSRQEFRSVLAAYEALTTRSPRAVHTPEEESAPTGTTRIGSTVEYLNFEVLEDRGWSVMDDDLFEKATTAGLDKRDCGRFEVRTDGSLLEAAEDHGFTWPYACRGGACANCAVGIVEGDIAMPAGHILPPEMIDRGIRLSCIGVPTTRDLKVVFNVKHRPDLDDLRLPPDRFDRAQSSNG